MVVFNRVMYLSIADISVIRASYGLSLWNLFYSRVHYDRHHNHQSEQRFVPLPKSLFDSHFTWLIQNQLFISVTQNKIAVA